MNDNQNYENFLLKVRERLAMIFDYHIPNGKPVIESDNKLIHVLYRVYYDGELEEMAKEPLRQVLTVQPDLFTTPEGPDLFSESDISSDKPDGTDIDYK